MNRQTTQQLYIRISKNSLSFAMDCGDEGICYEPYEVKAGISMAVNLREAFKTSELLRKAPLKATVIIDSPTMLVPIEEFQAEEMEEQFHMVFSSCKGEAIEMSVVPALKNMAVFSMSRDLKTVLNDHFEDLRIKPLMSSVWEYLLRRSYGSNNKKLYAYFHDGKMELCCFQRTRFAFVNTFEADSPENAIYFILGVWKQIGAMAKVDDLFICGTPALKDKMNGELKQFLARIFYINPAADFNRAPATQILNMPFDMMLQLM